MAQQQAIKLKIAGKSYSFTLKHEANEEQSLAEKEELYRLAEREVNAYVTRLKARRSDVMIHAHAEAARSTNSAVDVNHCLSLNRGFYEYLKC